MASTRLPVQTYKTYQSQMGYKVWDHETQNVVQGRSLQFIEQDKVDITGVEEISETMLVLPVLQNDFRAEKTSLLC